MSRPIGLDQARRYVRTLIADAGCEGRVELVDIRNGRKHFVAILRGDTGREGMLTLSHNIGARASLADFRRKNTTAVRRLVAA